MLQRINKYTRQNKSLKLNSKIDRFIIIERDAKIS